MARFVRPDVRGARPAGAVAAGRGGPGERARHARRSGRRAGADVQRAHGHLVLRPRAVAARTCRASSPSRSSATERLYGLGISNMKGALACYVEAVRALRDADVRAARATSWSRRSAARSRRRSRATRRAPSTAATRPARATSSPTAASRTCASSASRPRSKVVLGHFGVALAAHLDARATSSTRRSARASATRTRSCACARCSTRCSSGSRPGRTIPRTPTAARRRSSTSARSQGGFGWRVSRTPHRTDLFLDVRVPPTKPMPVRAARGARVGARARRPVPGLRRRGRGLRDRARRGDRRGSSARGGDRRGHAEVFGSPPERDVTRWFSRRVGADPLRRADRQLRHLDRAAGHRVRREPRDRRARPDGGGLRAGRPAGLRGRMKLVTFDDGLVGELRDDRVVELDAPSMREYFEARRGAAGRPAASSRSRTCGCARRSCRRSSSTRPATSASTRRSRRTSPGRTRSRRGSCSSRTSTRSSGRTTRSSTRST